MISYSSYGARQAMASVEVRLVKSDNPREATDNSVYQVLCKVAEQALVCPTNREIGARLGKAHNTVAGAVGRLERKGMISIERSGGYHFRVITITATGKKTAAPSSAAA